MKIVSIRRPWEKVTGRNSKTYKSDPYYQSNAWKSLRTQHRNGYTTIDNVQIPNTMCIDCYKENKRMVLGSNTDHIIARKDGGKDSLDNLQTQCDKHHASKSANEGNMRRLKPNNILK